MGEDFLPHSILRNLYVTELAIDDLQVLGTKWLSPQGIAEAGDSKVSEL